MRAAVLAGVVLAAGAVSAAPARADGLQALDEFIASARRNNPDNHEAQATAEQAAAQRDTSRASYLPSLSVQGTYTRNQFESSFAVPGGSTVVLQARDAFDANVVVSVPLINVGAWAQHRASALNAAAADASRTTSAASIDESVTQAYYQLLGAEAVAFVAQHSVEVSQGNLQTVRDRRRLGTASDLDVQRATASVAAAVQDAASAEQDVVLARRSLESLTRLAPAPATGSNYREDDLRDEPPLAEWQRGADALVAVQPARIGTTAAEASRDAARAAWLPTVTAQATEHLANASGFTGKGAVYTLTATASWRFDFGRSSDIRAQTAGVHVAQAREDRARRAAEDAIYRAWHQVRLGIAKARAAREQLKAATLAQSIARDRYASGVATQLEVVQAQRDLFSAGVSQAQADFDLQYARALLRIVSRRT